MIDYTSYVNIKQGTFSQPRYSYGNTLPLVAAPFGMNTFCLQTNASDGGWFYHPSHKQTEGVRLTHQPSPWVRDYGHLVFMPQSGGVYITENDRSSGFTEICMNPAFMEVYFKRYGAKMGITASERCSVMEVDWDTDDTPRLAVLPFDFLTSIELNPEKAELTGWTNAYGDGTRKDFKIYFYMKFDKPVNVSETVITRNLGEVENRISGSGIGVGINIAFDISKGEVLTVKLGTSYISSLFAKANVEREISTKTYDEIINETKSKWNELLSKIKITDTEEKKKTFYSCMYRCFLFPRIFYEYDAQENAVHYSTKSGLVCPGIMYTDNGFWDTYRTLYPLFALIIPNRLKEMLEGYLNFYKEEGWLPKWISPGERGIMPGTLIDAVFTDAAVKGLLTEEQMELALEGMLKNATISSGTHLNGRIGVADYVEKGYVPSDKYKESVCAISNQPSFHLPYLYSAVGENGKTAYWVKRIVEEAFYSTEKGFPGDEDNGSMSAWYVFSVLGMYPLCPGKAEYVVGVCNAEEIKLSLGNGRRLTIKNKLYHVANYSGLKVSIDNRENVAQTISHKELLEAEVITFYQEENILC